MKSSTYFKQKKTSLFISNPFKCLIGFLLFFLLFYNNIFAQLDTLYICNPGDSVQLEAPQGQFAYQWTPTVALSNPTIYNPIASPDTLTIYTVKMIPALLGENLIENADFSGGNTAFSSDYSFVERINTQGVFGLSESAFLLNSAYFEDCPDHTDGMGQMMVVDGSPTPNERVWCQTVEVKPNTQYAFSAWLTSVNINNPARLQFSINGINLGTTFRASNSVCEWRQFFEVWNNGTGTSAEICIVNQNINPQGNDFALDDFAFYELEEIQYKSIVVAIEAVEAAKERRVYIPTAFSPNQDGINEQFLPLLGKGAIQLASFQIFNRWGGLLYERSNCAPNDLTCAWDGTQAGKPLEKGVYIYLAQIIYADGYSVWQKGEIKLLR